MNIGISACLLGHSVRYDANHSLNHYLRDKLGQFVSWVPVCPEFESGLPAPREAIRLVLYNNQIQLQTAKNGRDQTERIEQWCLKWSKILTRLQLRGFVFKAKSPCCGLSKIKIYSSEGKVEYYGTGKFAQLFQQINPMCPVIDEGRLQDISLRDGFLTQIFTTDRWYQALSEKSYGAFQRFHVSHKYLFLGLSPSHKKKMGQLAAHPSITTFLQYESLLFKALCQKRSCSKNFSVFQRFLSHIKKELSTQESIELLEIFSLYKRKQIPLQSVLMMCKHYALKFKNQYLLNQYFLEPYPQQLLQLHSDHPEFL